MSFQLQEKVERFGTNNGNGTITYRKRTYMWISREFFLRKKLEKLLENNEEDNLEDGDDEELDVPLEFLKTEGSQTFQSQTIESKESCLRIAGVNLDKSRMCDTCEKEIAVYLLEIDSFEMEVLCERCTKRTELFYGQNARIDGTIKDLFTQ